MTAHVFTATIVGFDGKLIEVECDSSKGLPTLQIVGLANKAIDEAKERVRSAITNSKLDYPRKRITINLAPANLPKNGADFDLPIAIAILVVSRQLTSENIKESLFAGELALDGKLRPIRNAVGIAETAKSEGIKRVFIPYQNAPQARLIKNIEVIGIRTLGELFLHLKNEQVIPAVTSSPAAPSAPKHRLTIDDIRGQEQAKRALVIAAVGHHNILFTGPPGAGKTMLAKALASLLPPLSLAEQIIITKIHNLAGHTGEEIITERPFRSPHHTTSTIALIGGGATSKPGEVSLAHKGVLFLDELPEYSRSSLESLRQPLEDHKVHISRANNRVSYPAHFMLIATQNPCPCGYYGDPTRECSCSALQIQTYQKRLSGPLLDRIDMIVPLGRVHYHDLLSAPTTHQHEAIQAKVIASRSIQEQRYGTSLITNASIENRFITEKFPLSEEVKNFLATASEKLQLTARSHFKIIKVARSIADLDKCEEITLAHISEALQYRQG